MKKLSIGLAVLLLLFIFISTSFASLYTTNGFYTYFNNPPNSKYIDKRVVELIDSAQNYCYVAVYALNLVKIREALINKKQSGVDVRVVTEADNRNNSQYKNAYDELEAAGIPVIVDNKSSLMHHKFIVVDDNEILAGSYNFTGTGTTYNKNNIVIIHSSGVAARFKNEFLQMYNGSFSNSKTDYSGMNTVAGAKVYVKFAPRAHCQSSMLYHLNTANVSVYFNIFTFTDHTIASKLLELYNNGVTVKGTFDEYQSGSSYSQYSYLKNNGVPVKLDSYAGFLHDKFIAIDCGTASTPKVITGSYNWTSSADNANDETMLILYDAQTVGRSYKGNAVYVYNYRAQ